MPGEPKGASAREANNCAETLKILARAMEVQTENWGNYAFFRDLSSFNLEKSHTLCILTPFGIIVTLLSLIMVKDRKALRKLVTDCSGVCCCCCC